MKVSIILILFCGLTMTVSAQDNTVTLVSQKFAALEEVMRPLWTGASANKDYPTIFAGGPNIEGVFIEITAIDPLIRNHARHSHYLALRQELGHRVTEFVEACQRRNESLVDKVLPRLRTVFEETRAQLKPLAFTPLDSMICTINIVLDTQIPDSDWEEIKKSTKSILSELETVKVAELPVELSPYHDKLTADFANIAMIAREMLSITDKRDVETVQAKAEAIRGLLVLIRENYL